MKRRLAKAKKKASRKELKYKSVSYLHLVRNDLILDTLQRRE